MTSLSGADSEPFTSLAKYLQEITEALAATSTQREVIEIILTPAVQVVGAVAGPVLLVDQTDQQMKIAGSQGYEDSTPTLWQEGPIEDHQLISDILRMQEARYFEHAGALRQAYPELERRTGGLLPLPTRHCRCSWTAGHLASSCWTSQNRTTSHPLNGVS